MKSYHLFLISILGFISIALYAARAIASPVQNHYETDNIYQNYIKKGHALYGSGKTKEAHEAYLKAFDYATTNAQDKTALGSLAVTSFSLGNIAQSEQYLADLLSMFPNNKWAKRFAICKTILPETDVPSQSLLSVDIQGIKDALIPVGYTFDVTWKSDGSIPSRKNFYEFIVFTMPHTVRFNGSGFLMLPPKVKLPFGFKFAPDQMRVLFPLYLPQSNKTQGTFQIRPLVAGNFTLKWAYAIVNECGDIVFSSQAKSQSMTFDVQTQKPVIVVQDKVGLEEPESVYLSPSKEYELRVFKDRFQILYADTGELILEKAGTSPNFSPGSRFIGFFSDIRSPFSVEILDLLNNKNIMEFIFEFETALQVVAWGKNDSFLIIGFEQWGKLKVILPWLEENNYFKATTCHICDAWKTSQFAIDLENSLIRFGSYAEKDLLQNKKTVDILLEENVFERRSEYPQFLQSLEFPILRKPPKAWELEEGFKVSHTGWRAEPGRNNFFYYPILKKNNLTTIKNDFFEKQESAIRGNARYRGRVLRPKTTESIDKNVLKRLGKMNIFVQENYAPLEQSNWLELEFRLNGKRFDSWKNLEMLDLGKEYQKNDSIDIDSEIIDTIKMNYPTFQNLTSFQLLNEGNCGMLMFSHSVKYSVFKNNSSQFLIIQTECNDMGTAQPYDGNLFIFSIVNGQYYNILLKKALEVFPYLNKELFEYLNLSGMVFLHNNPINSFLSGDNILLISSINNSSIIVFDANIQKVTAAFSGIPEAQDLESLYLTQDGRFVLQINKGGGFYFYDIATQQRILNGIYVDDEIVLYTDDGFYDATPEGAHYVTWHYPGLKQHFDFNQFESKFKRPDIIKGILTGHTLQKPNIQFLPPPSVEMVLKHPGNYAKQATVELSATSIRPLSNLRLFVDGAPVAEISVAGKQAQKIVPLELKRGKHWITAVAYNDQGYSSIPKSVMIDASAIKAKGSQLYVLGVGIDNYPNMPIANLDYAKQDIIAFAETVRANPAQLYENIVIEQLLDEKATPTNIYQTLTNIVQQATIDDTLMLYFAGHGEKGKDGKFYFLTSQASFDDFKTTGLAWKKVAVLLAQTKAKVIVFLDACHSGVASQETVVPNDEYVAEFMKTGKAGMVVMAASKGRQFSFEDIDFGDGHGAFNYAITLALSKDRQITDSNQNGIVELSELYRSVKFNVHKLTDGEQTPWLSRNEIIGEMPIL